MDGEDSGRMEGVGVREIFFRRVFFRFLKIFVRRDFVLLGV